VLDDQQVTAILGKNVRGRNGEDMGRIVDVIVNRDGQVRAAIVDFGGFLGVGSRKIAVDWSALRFEPSGKPDRISVDLSRNSVRLAPEYKEGTPVVVLGPELSQPVATGPAKDAAKEK
jgi:sporulation protein YlmC with PRC-barrel domain